MYGRLTVFLVRNCVFLVMSYNDACLERHDAQSCAVTRWLHCVQLCGGQAAAASGGRAAPGGRVTPLPPAVGGGPPRRAGSDQGATWWE